MEDVITSGKSLIETIAEVEQEDLKVADIVVVLDREQGGKQLLKAEVTECILFLTFQKFVQFFGKTVNFLMMK